MVMDATVIATMVSVAGTIIGSVISANVALSVANKQHDKTIALIEYRLKELEDKVDKHNNVIERLYVVESKVDMLSKTKL